MKALALLLALSLSACAGTLPYAASTVAASAWVRSELYFGLGAESGVPDRPQDTPIGEKQWRGFLDAEVTPRFPDGLTVLEAYGQWRPADAGVPSRLRSKVLVILHEDTPQRRADIEAIRTAWKRMTGQDSVLWAKEKIEVSF